MRGAVGATERFPMPSAAASRSFRPPPSLTLVSMEETPSGTVVGADDLEKVAELREAAEEAKEMPLPEHDLIERDPGADPEAPEPEGHGPVDLPEPQPQAELPPHVQAVIEQLAYRLLFTEAALTRTIRLLVSNGILPANFEDRLIAEAEVDVDAIGIGRHREEGRAGLIAAYVNHTRTD